MASATRDEDRVPSLIAKSDADTTPVVVEADPITKRLKVSAVITGGGASDGAIVDGVDGTLKATVLDYADSNPVAVRLTDTNGDYVAAGAGTQYTDAGTPPAHPVGSALEFNNGGVWATVGSSNPLPVYGTVTANAGTNLNTSTLALEAGGNLAAAKIDLDTIAGTVSSSKMAVKVADGDDATLGAKADAKSTATDTTAVSIMSVLKQISASVQAPPSQAVTNAGTFAVQATLAAETTKVIGTVRTADGSGNLYTTNSTTYTAKFGQDTNLLGTLGIAFSTAGKVDIKGADGDVFVRNATAANFLANVTLQTQTDTVMVGGINVKEINGVAPLMGNGASGTGAMRVTVASDSTGVLGATQSGTWTVQPGNTANTTPWLVTDTPATSGGLSIITGSVGATATAIKASAGQLYGYHLFNTTAAVAYVQIFNMAAASVTLGTTAPTISIGIPASGGVTANFDKGIAFGTAISYACTTTRAGSTGATCDVNFFYK